MLFNSYEFLFIFFPIVIIVFYSLSYWSRSFGLSWIILSSLFFYGFWSFQYLLLIIASVVVNYMLALFIERYKSKALMIVGIAVNFAVIGWFKYSLFLYSILTKGENPPSFIENIILPLGISFFTFQQIAYLINVWRGNERAASLKIHSFIVLFFPHLIAGPLVLYENLATQVRRNATAIKYLSINLKIGLFIFAIGLFKKVVVADSLEPFASDLFNYSTLPGVTIGFRDSWLAALTYSLQLYFDFSGYSDMAIGLARMLGFRLPTNFNSPYKAVSIIDFWRRWHISLSLFFRYYVYIPLGGNRSGWKLQLIFVFITFFLIGLWHGASWLFVAWGVSHGLLVGLNHAWRKLTKSTFDSFFEVHHWMQNLYYLIARLVTIATVVILWVPFRSESAKGASNIIVGMMNPFFKTNTLFFSDGHYYVVLGAAVLSLFAWCCYAPNLQEFISSYKKLVNSKLIAAWYAQLLISNAAYIWSVGLLLYISFSSIGYVKSKFIYFNF